jgi:hypothetical protein
MDKLFAVIFILSFTACKEISYKEPQPKGKRALSEIPRELRGSYLLVEENGNNQDTLIVTKNGYYFTNDSTKGELSDSLVLKKYQGYYFFNDNENPEWLLRVVKKESNGDLSYMYMDPGEKSFHEFLYSLNKEIKIDSFEVDNDMLYQIDPNPKQLIGLIKKGYFKKSIILKKVK